MDMRKLHTHVLPNQSTIHGHRADFVLKTSCPEL